MDVSPNAAFGALMALLLGLSAYFTVDVELRRAALRGDASAVELASGDAVTLVAAVDGDELSVDKDGQRFTLRLIGVKAFETIDEPGFGDAGQRATAALQAHAGAPAVVRFTEYATDRSGRVLAYVDLPCAPEPCTPDDLGASLVREGYVAVYTKYPFERSATYLGIEAEARAAQRGLWGFPKAARRVDDVRAAWEDAE